MKFEGIRSAHGSGAGVGFTTRGDTMPTVIAHHDVKDTKHWLASPKREEVFGPLGVNNIRTFVDPVTPAMSTTTAPSKPIQIGRLLTSASPKRVMKNKLSTTPKPIITPAPRRFIERSPRAMDTYSRAATTPRGLRGMKIRCCRGRVK